MGRRWWIVIAILLGAAVASPGPVAAVEAVPSTDDAPARTVDLARLIDEARRNNPGLRAKRHAYEAARSRVIAAWLPDDPEIGVDVEGQSGLFKLDRRDNEFSVAQSVPFPTTLVLRGRIAAKEAAIACERYKEEERQVIWHLEQPYYELVVARKTVAALEETRSMLERLSRIAQAKYESNKASQHDLLKAEIERTKIGIDVFNAQQQAHLAEAHFSHILNEPLHTRYVLAPERRSPALTRSLADLETLALRTRPELRALDIGIARAKTSRWLARTSWLPRMTGRIEARHYSGESGLREYDTFIGMTVPVWSLLKGASGEWKGAGHDVEEAQAEYVAMKNEVLLAIHEAYAKLQSAQHAVDLYEHALLLQARQQVEVAIASYEAGTADFLPLIDAERTLKELQLTYYTIVADYERGWSDLRLAVGDDLRTAESVGPAVSDAVANDAVSQ